MILGERDGGGPRVASQDKTGGGQELPEPEAPTSGVFDAGTGHGNDHTSE